MTLYVRSYSFSDPSFSDSPVVENDEGTRTFRDQVRSAGQQYIAVIIKEVTDTENTVVKVIKKDATELYETTINKNAKLWDVNDNGEVLLYTETVSNGSTTRELICIDNTGSVKWSVDLGSTTPNAIEIGTDYAGIVVGSNVRFFSAADGSEVNSFDTGHSITGNGKYQKCYGSADGFTLVYPTKPASDKNGVVFANADGDVWYYEYGNTRQLFITGRDIHCGRVSVWQQWVSYRWIFSALFRTGEKPTIDTGESPYSAPPGDCVISPCGEWIAWAYNNKIRLYYVAQSELKEISETSYASGQSGEKYIDLSFYGKYALILHDSNTLCVYELKAQAHKDSLDNPLGTRAVMLCSD